MNPNFPRGKSASMARKRLADKDALCSQIQASPDAKEQYLGWLDNVEWHVLSARSDVAPSIPPFAKGASAGRRTFR